MEKRAALLLPLILVGCASAPPYGTTAWAQERYVASTQVCENEYRKQWREYLTGLEFVSTDYTACLARAKAGYGRDLQAVKGT